MKTIDDFYAENAECIQEDDSAIINDLISSGEDPDTQRSVCELLKEIRKQAFEAGKLSDDKVGTISLKPSPSISGIPEMTLRDWYYGMALAGLSACENVSIEESTSLSKKVGDAMMKARNEN